MAVWEAKKQVKSWNKITQVSWTDWVTMDNYYWLEHSFLYSSNINADDELHGIKLSSRAWFTDKYAKCQLISLWNSGVAALPMGNWATTADIKRFKYNGHNFSSPANSWKYNQTHMDYTIWQLISENFDTVPGVIFQDYLWFWQNGGTELWIISRTLAQATDTSSQQNFIPYDHDDYTDESIMTPSTTGGMTGEITAILNYNNTRLVVACAQDIWVYYPELDWGGQDSGYYGTQWRKKTLHFEPGTVIVWLTCTFEYLKVWTVDEGWNSKVYYYQGNNNLRSTFVYNVIDLTGQKVLRVYSINWTDYYVNSIDGTDWLVNLNKMIGNVPVKLLTQRAWLTSMDINDKDPYFVGPVGINATYNDGNIYIADQYGVFKFRQNMQGYDRGYMKWQLRDFTSYSSTPVQVFGVCENQGFLYVSDSLGCWAMRLYDTWVDGYQGADWNDADSPSYYYSNYRSKPQWVLISREFEGKEWGTVTKMLDEIRMNFELNPLTTGNWTIDVYVSPNNLWKSTSDFTLSNNWWHAMSIKQRNWKTRAEKSNLFNDLQSWESSFKFDWQTITYAIVIKVWTTDTATPIVRQLDILYHCKDKINEVYTINSY